MCVGAVRVTTTRGVSSWQGPHPTPGFVGPSPSGGWRLTPLPGCHQAPRLIRSGGYQILRPAAGGVVRNIQIGGRTVFAIRRGIPAFLKNSERTIARPEGFFAVTVLVCARTATHYGNSRECVLLGGRLKAMAWHPGSRDRRGTWSPGRRHIIGQQLPRDRVVHNRFGKTITLSGWPFFRKPP